MIVCVWLQPLLPCQQQHCATLTVCAASCAASDVALNFSTAPPEKILKLNMVTVLQLKYSSFQPELISAIAAQGSTISSSHVGLKGEWMLQRLTIAPEIQSGITRQDRPGLAGYSMLI